MLARDAGAGVDIKSAETLVLGPECRRFSYGELETATNGYPDANVIGEGGFGKVRAGSAHAAATTNAGPPGSGRPVNVLQRAKADGALSFGRALMVAEQLPHWLVHTSWPSVDPVASIILYDLTCLSPCAGVPGHPGGWQVHCGEEAGSTRHAGQQLPAKLRTMSRRVHDSARPHVVSQLCILSRCHMLQPMWRQPHTNPRCHV